MRKLIKANLEALGLKVREAISAQHALHRLSEAQPDLILLDLDLLEDDVPHWLQALYDQFTGQAVPIVIISAEPPNRHVLQNWQVVGHLLKPFAVPALLEQVQTALKNSPNVD